MTKSIFLTLCGLIASLVALSAMLLGYVFFEWPFVIGDRQGQAAWFQAIATVFLFAWGAAEAHDLRTELRRKEAEARTRRIAANDTRFRWYAMELREDARVWVRNMNELDPRIMRLKVRDMLESYTFTTHARNIAELDDEELSAVNCRHKAVILRQCEAYETLRLHLAQHPSEGFADAYDRQHPEISRQAHRVSRDAERMISGSEPEG
ncbi:MULTISPECIES: hypothetical protein [unclassified Pseudoxanthomonas]|uniref:hypothetical protein n=1 Tax=unclassified Pseudoxanthomonas TaxID=2645906 RepID=UPI0008E2D07E|nr:MULTISPECIES: hypothetical protein [unclassified Pseudoxanthomonas]SFV26417.1 hypothetical protein SAMN05428990_0309 [Pseudoxanthomonas sp. YR558]